MVLMLVFIVCGCLLMVLDFWKEVIMCKEGLGYLIFVVVFWVLEKWLNGVKMVWEVWDWIENMDVDVFFDVYNVYVGVMVSSG